MVEQVQKGPAVSVIMNCYNSSQFLREALDSVFQQTFKDFEVVFWDNRSTDESAEIAKSYGEKVKYYLGDKFLSLGAARNAALSKARGQYITFLDCDDIWYPKKLEKQISVFEENPKVDFIYTNYYRYNTMNNYKYLALKGKQPEGNVFDKFLYRNPVGLLTAAIRKSAIKDIEEFFDERLNLCEEYDFFMRILYTSKAVYIKETLALYRIHENMSSLRSIDKYPEENLYIIEKYKRLYPDFEATYCKAIKFKKAKAEFLRARLKMVEGHLKDARIKLSPYKFVEAKILITYLATYVPYSFWRLLKPIWSKYLFKY